jgi:mRNA-degrading endonuclease RelE of RelBE toxin-antitoxin system
MKKYQITILKQALKDLDELSIVISEVYKAPITAKNYTEGLILEIRSLCNHAESLPISINKEVLKYGINARQVNYKKHTVIYTVKDDIVVIRKIIISSLIKS